MRALYVDDEPSLCRAFSRMFGADSAVDVSTASSPLEAIGLLTQADAFDVIISDLRMPGMDGIELLSTARDKCPLARRILVSGFADLDTALSAIKSVGIDRMFSKPWDMTEVITAVRASGEHALLARENARIALELAQATIRSETLEREMDDLVGRGKITAAERDAIRRKTDGGS